MKNNIYVSKLGQALKISFGIFLASSAFNAYAEYYVVYATPAPTCGGCCHHRYVPRHRIYHPIYHQRYIHRTGCHHGYYATVRYPRAWIAGHPDCYGQWIPGHWRNYYYQTNYAYPNMIYDPDMTTGDDNPMLDPDMDIDH